MNDLGESAPSISAVEPAPEDPEPCGRLAVAILDEAGDVVRRDLVARIVQAYDKAGNSK